MFDVNDKNLLERFWSKVVSKEPGKCWEWKGSTTKFGYGCFIVKVDGAIKNIMAHRISWQLANPDKELISGMHIAHACDNRKCVNPEHLSQTTAQENMIQCMSRGRGRWKHKGMNLESVREIREKAVTWEGMCMMMLKYRISQSAIRQIMDGKSWQWALPPKVE